MNERIEYRLTTRPNAVLDPLRQSAAQRRETRWALDRTEVEIRQVSDRGGQEIVHVHYLRSLRG